MMEDGVHSNPLMINVQRMVTLLRKLSMDQFQYHLISESQITQETVVINSPDGTKRK
jgi:hypothetical protein